MSEACSKCDKAVRETSDLKVWEVIEQTDFKEKVLEFVGFPSGGTHTIKGWKARKVARITSIICPDCKTAIAQEVSNTRPKARRNMLTALWVELGLIALTVLAYSTDTWAVGLTIVSVIGAIVTLLLFMSLSGHTPQWGIDRAHSEFAKKKAGAIAKERNLPTDISFGPSMSDAKGILFCVEPDAWTEMSKEYAETEERTGWSKLQFLSEQGYTSSQWSESAGAEQLNVAHLGIVLDTDEWGA